MAEKICKNNINGKLSNEFICPICGSKYKNSGILCNDCLNEFFCGVRGEPGNNLMDKYISYDDLRGGEYETAFKRSIHDYGFERCVVCWQNNVDKSWNKRNYIGRDTYYNKFFLCKECITKFLLSYNKGLCKGHENFVCVGNKQSLPKNASFEKFKNIWLEVKIHAENMSFRGKLKRYIKSEGLVAIFGILLVIVLGLILIVLIVGLIKNYLLK